MKHAARRLIIASRPLGPAIPYSAAGWNMPQQRYSSFRFNFTLTVQAVNATNFVTGDTITGKSVGTDLITTVDTWTITTQTNNGTEQGFYNGDGAVQTSPIGAIYIYHNGILVLSRFG